MSGMFPPSMVACYADNEGAVRTYKLLSDGRRQIGAFHLPGDIFGVKKRRPSSIYGRSNRQCHGLDRKAP